MNRRKGPGIIRKKQDYRSVKVTLWDDGRWEVGRDNCFPIDCFAMSQLLDFYARMQLTQSFMAQAQQEATRDQLMRRIALPSGSRPQ